jgi:hypothetical protein
VSSLPPTLIRRMVLAPLAVVAAVGEVIVSPVLLLAALALDLGAGGHRVSRVVRFGTWYCLYEAGALLGLLGLWLSSGLGLGLGARRMQDAHYCLMAWWLRGLWSAANRTFGLRMAVEPGREPGPGPILAFSRHGGVANLMVLLATLLVNCNLRPRVIMVEKFQWEPVLNALLNRLPNAFIRRGAVHREATIDAIGAVARGMGSHDAFVLFPEGHDFSLRRRAQAIDRLRQRGHEELAGKAEQMAHVLAPRIGGVTAAIAAAPEADVVFMAHTLVEVVGSAAHAWRHIPLETPVWVCFWRVPAAEVPHDGADVATWLYAWWARIDAWIAGRVPRPGPALHEQGPLR